MYRIQNNLGSTHISSKSLFMLLSETQSFSSIGLRDHHQQVAFLAYHLGKEYGLDEESLRNLFLASLIHDIGALSLTDLKELDRIEIVPDFDNNHATKGADLILSFSPFKNLSPIIRYHHLPWRDGKGSEYKGEEVPIETHILQLADLVSIRVGNKDFPIKYMPELLEELNRDKGKYYVPELVEVMESFASSDHIWLDFVQENPIELMDESKLFDTLTLEISETTELAHMISKIIDFRSRFTATHSAGVASTATELSRLFNFSPQEQGHMLIAGYLHDIGKIAIKREILEKPDKLTRDEMLEMRSHTYYTAKMLNTIPQFHTINLWASLHHEKLDGKGYPFAWPGDNLSLGSRIMAVADVFTAITENRPYREGLSKERSSGILLNMVEGRALDGIVVNKLLENFEAINKIRIEAQEEALAEFVKFFPG